MTVPGCIQGLFGLMVVGAAVYGVERFRRTRRKPGMSDLGAGTMRLRAWMRRMAQPTVLLTAAESPGFSKVGGLPDLPHGIAWPEGDCAPPAFVVQVDIAAVRKQGDFDWLPESGRLYFFFDDDRNGAADSGKFIYTTALPGPEAAAPSRLPKTRRFLERRVDFGRFTSLPSEDWLGAGWPGDDANWQSPDDLNNDDLGAKMDEDVSDLSEGADLGGAIEHRIGGYPSEIQGGRLNIECEYLSRGVTWDYKAAVPDPIRIAAQEWRLLLQIDTDPALKMNWWDGGRLYVFVRERDARCADFSETVTLTQSY